MSFPEARDSSSQMTGKAIKRNIQSSFPLIASLEKRRICPVFLVLERRQVACSRSVAYFDHKVG